MTAGSQDALAQEVVGIDLQGAPLPLAPQTGSILESAVLPSSGRVSMTLRTSLLRSPVSLRFPSTTPKLTAVPFVDSAILEELSASIPLSKGWDAGFGFGAHLHQSGEGVSGEGTTLTAFGARDPRLGVGWTGNFRRWHYRPFAQFFVPLGNQQALAGEQFGRFKVGVAHSSPAGAIRWTSEVSYLYRQEVEVSSSTWGPQLIIAQGAQLNIGSGFGASVEALVSPVLSSQTSRSGEAGGTLVPAEVLVSGRYGENSWSLGLTGGVGLPLSRISSIHADVAYRRAPSAPTMRGFVDIRLER